MRVWCQGNRSKQVPCGSREAYFLFYVQAAFPIELLADSTHRPQGSQAIRSLFLRTPFLFRVLVRDCDHVLIVRMQNQYAHRPRFTIRAMIVAEPLCQSFDSRTKECMAVFE
jgi:hypothetical protein